MQTHQYTPDNYGSHRMGLFQQQQPNLPERELQPSEEAFYAEPDKAEIEHAVREKERGYWAEYEENPVKFMNDYDVNSEFIDDPEWENAFSRTGSDGRKTVQFDGVVMEQVVKRVLTAFVRRTAKRDIEEELSVPLLSKEEAAYYQKYGYA